MALTNQVGSFCWWSLMTKDVAAANDFYIKLFGWTMSHIRIPGEDESAIYGAEHGGFANPVPLESDSDVPSHWIPYIAVTSVDEACQAAEKLGGSICVPAFDIPTIGRTAVVSDPVGAAFHVYTPSDKDENLNMIGNGTGEVCWMELMVDDPAPLFPFYAEMFGWDFAETMAINGGEYTSFMINGEQAGGLMKRPPDVPKMPPAWMNYFAVESVEKWSSRVAELGGTIHVPKTEVPETGYFALVEDPTGACSYLFELWK